MPISVLKTALAKLNKGAKWAKWESQVRRNKEIAAKYEKWRQQRELDKKTIDELLNLPMASTPAETAAGKSKSKPKETPESQSSQEKNPSGESLGGNFKGHAANFKQNDSKQPKGHGGLIVLVVLALLGGIIFWFMHHNAPPITIQSGTPTPTAAQIKSEYSTLHNTIDGYDLEYPASWRSSIAPNGEAELTGQKGTMIEIQYSSQEYQAVFNALTAQDTIDSKVAKLGDRIYSTFWTKVPPVERVYACNMTGGTLILKCSNPSSLDTIACAGEVIGSFHLLGTAKVLTPTPVAHSPSPVLISPTPAPVLSPTPAPTSTAPLSPSNENTINPQTGIYKKYNLGLVDTAEGVLSGDGCYDDTGKFIILINNKNATNPTYSQLVNFLQKDKTDQFPYNYTGLSAGFYYGTAESHVDLNRVQSIIDGKIQPSPPDICADFAERLHNDAEMAGIRCAYVGLELTGYTDPDHLGIPSNSGHACDAFQTTDKGLIYIDDTGWLPNKPHPSRAVKTVNIIVGQQYVPVSLFPQPGWQSTDTSMGTVTSIKVTWDGTWNNN